jgi:hypothetical protein
VVALAAVPRLPELVASLPPRAFALLGRALAVLLARTAERSADGGGGGADGGGGGADGGGGGALAAECTAPDLCTSCVNNSLLCAMPLLLPRLLALLNRTEPLPGLVAHSGAPRAAALFCLVRRSATFFSFRV